MNVLKRQISGFARHRRKSSLTKHLSSSITKRVRFLIILLLALVGGKTVGMMVFEKMSFSDGLWMSLTTITTVGYGDLVPTSLACLEWEACLFGSRRGGRQWHAGTSRITRC